MNEQEKRQKEKKVLVVVDIIGTLLLIGLLIGSLGWRASTTNTKRYKANKIIYHSLNNKEGKS